MLFGNVEVSGRAVIDGYTKTGEGKFFDGRRSDPDYEGIAKAKAAADAAAIAEADRIAKANDIKTAREKSVNQYNSLVTEILDNRYLGTPSKDYSFSFPQLCRLEMKFLMSEKTYLGSGTTPEINQVYYDLTVDLSEKVSFGARSEESGNKLLVNFWANRDVENRKSELSYRNLTTGRSSFANGLNPIGDVRYSTLQGAKGVADVLNEMVQICQRLM
jgi:hypothetical protein